MNYLQLDPKGKWTFTGKTGVQVKLESASTPQLIGLIKDFAKLDDWRDVFEAIHNWGYNTDFTYNSVTDPDRHTVKEYLINYLIDVYGEEE